MITIALRSHLHHDFLFPRVVVRVAEFINLDAAEVHSGFMRFFFCKEIDFTTVRLEA